MPFLWGLFIGAGFGIAVMAMCNMAGRADDLIEYRSRPGRGKDGFMEREKPKVIVLCGSSRFVDIMAVCGWILERDENAVVMGLHLLPEWYPDCPPDHLAEHEGCAKEIDELHFRKIDLADEIFVVNFNGYIGDGTTRQVRYAKAKGRPVRWFTHDPVGGKVTGVLFNAREKHNYLRFPSKPKRIRDLQSDIHQNAVDHGWWENERPAPEILCLIHSEVSEALEAYRKNDAENFAEELADIAIRLLDAAEGYGIDLEGEIVKKHEYNKTREYRHGGKAC